MWWCIPVVCINNPMWNIINQSCSIFRSPYQGGSHPVRYWQPPSCSESRIYPCIADLVGTLFVPGEWLSPNRNAGTDTIAHQKSNEGRILNRIMKEFPSFMQRQSTCHLTLKKGSWRRRVLTRYSAWIPGLDDARVRPDEILPRRCRLDLNKMEEILIKHCSIGFHQTQRVNSMADIRKWERHGRTLNATWCSLLFTALRLQ
jgi:hypothetical protein